MEKIANQWVDFEQLFEAAPCGLMVIDRHAAVHGMNRAAARLLRIDDPQTAVGSQLTELLPQWKGTEFHASLPSLLSAQATFEAISFEVTGPDRQPLRIAASGIPQPQGPSRCVLLVLNESAADVAVLEKRLHRAEYQASIGKLARGIAHELNSPLDGVLRYLHLALEQTAEGSRMREYLVSVREGLERMVRAVKAFLEFSRQVTMPVNRLADLNKLVEDALLLVRHRAEFQKIRVVLQLQPDLPQVTDAGLSHAVVNIVKNAFDAMPRGGALTVRTRTEGAHVHLDVEDTGCGIPEEIRSRIFEPFFSTKPVHQGSGLGLIIAKEGVERSGGTLEFTSQAGSGTTFRMHLPLPAAGEATIDGGA